MPTWRQALRTDRIPYGLVALETTQAHTKSLYVPKSMLDGAIPTSRPERPVPLRYWAHGGGGAKRRLYGRNGMRKTLGTCCGAWDSSTTNRFFSAAAATFMASLEFLSFTRCQSHMAGATEHS